MSNHIHNHKPHAEGSNNFLVGMLVGGGLALLFTTDRGREILKELSDAGLDAIQNLEKKAHEMKLQRLEEVAVQQEIDAEDEEDLAAAAPLPTATQIEREIETIENNPKHPATQSRVQRFFKGAKKKH